MYCNVLENNNEEKSNNSQLNCVIPQISYKGEMESVECMEQRGSRGCMGPRGDQGCMGPRGDRKSVV